MKEWDSTSPGESGMGFFLNFVFLWMRGERERGIQHPRNCSAFLMKMHGWRIQHPKRKIIAYGRVGIQH